MANEINPIDLAWQAAVSANTAFDRLREARTHLEALRMVGDLGLQGVVIGEEAYQTLEQRQTDAQRDFDTFTSIAAPVMLLEDSPFRVLEPSPVILLDPQAESPSDKFETDKLPDFEGVFNFAATARTRKEFADFARVRGYASGIAGRAFGVVFRTASRAGSAFNVGSLADYENMARETPQPLAAIRPAVDKRKYDFIEDPSDALDIQALHRAVVEWLERDPDIRELPEGSISFLADYLNHALPGIDPLPVSKPVEKRTSSRAKFQNLSPRELLLEEANIDGQDVYVVNHRSMQRYLIAGGALPQSLSHLDMLFSNLAKAIKIGITGTEDDSLSRSTDIVLLSTHRPAEFSRRENWGITPRRFIAVIRKIEDSPALQDKIGGYTEFSRPLIDKYVEGLQQFLDSQDNK